MTPVQSAMTAAFWRWLALRASRLTDLADPDSPFWDDVLAQLKAVDDGLWLEIGGNMEPRELVLTASGDPGLFDLVDAICAQAPAIAGWCVVALKPALCFGVTLRWENVTVKPQTMWFKTLSLPDTPGTVGLQVAVPGYTCEAERAHCMAVLLLLDSALGERAAARDVHLVEVIAPPPDPQAAGYLPMVDLPAFLTWRTKRPVADH